VKPAARVITALVGVLALLGPTGTAAAGDDPVPSTWPTIGQPDGGGQSDPKPTQWVEVAQPDASTNGDPKPKEWPTPAPG
jgi:hypothetical protein